MSTEEPNVCEAVIETIDDYINGDAQSEKYKKLDEHLVTCANCRAYVESYRKMIELTRTAIQLDSDDTKVPNGLIEKILNTQKKT